MYNRLVKCVFTLSFCHLMITFANGLDPEIFHVLGKYSKMKKIRLKLFSSKKAKMKLQWLSA